MLNRVYAAIDGFLNSSALCPDPDVTRQAFICNLCALIGAVGTSIFLLVYLVMDAALFGPIILVSLVLIPSFGIAVLFNRRGWFESAKIAVFTSGFATLINGSWMLGSDSGVHLMLLSFPVLAGQMWARQRLEITVPFTVLSGAVVAFLHAATGVGLLGPIPESYSIVFLTASISIALLLLFFTQYQSLYRMDVVTANLQKALDFMPGAIMAGNERGDVIFVNEQTNRLFKLPEGHVKEGSSLHWVLDEMLKAGANHTDEGVEYTTDEVYAMFASRDTVPLTVQHSDGRFLEVVKAPTPSGGFVAVATDISGRINAIRDAEEQRMIAEQVLDNMGEGILMVDGEGKVAAFNRRVSEYYEMTPEEVRRSRGQDYEEMLSYVYLEKYNLPERLETVLASVRRGDSFSDDDVLPDGRVIEVRQRPMAAGGFVKMYLDVTESRQAAAELSRQKEIANQALENMGEGLMMIDADGRIAAFNQRVLQYFDMSEREVEDLLGQEYAGVLSYLYLKKYNNPKQYEAAIADTKRRDEFSKDLTLPNGRVIEIRQTPMSGGGFVRIYVDETEKRQAAQELARQKEIADLTMQNMSEGILMVNADGKVAAHNRRVHDYFILDGSEPRSYIGFDFRDLNRDAYLALGMETEAKESIERLDQSDGPFKHDDHLPNGTIIETRHQPIPDGGFVRVYVDVTDSRHAEEELARQKDIARRALENMGEGILMVDSDWRIVAINSRTVEYYGTEEDSAEDWIGVDYVESLKQVYLVDQNLPELYEESIANLRRTEAYAEDDIRPDGRILEVRHKPLPDGSFIKFYLDVTEIRHASAELTRQKDIANQALENMGDGILMVDAEGRLVAHNQQALDYFDLDDEMFERLGEFPDYDAVSRYTLLEKMNLPDAYEQRMREVRENKATSSDAVLPNGRVIESRHRPMADGGFVRVHTDVTEMRHAASELARQKDIATQAQQRAEESDRSKSEFLANMSHEIRTPMNAILGLTHLALKTDLTDKQQDYLQKVNSSATSLLTIINDILDLSKIEAGKLDMEAVEFSLDETLSNVATLIADKAQEKGLEFLFEVPASIRRQLIGDSLRLAQVLINLANNAVKFTEQGEVVISVEPLDETESDVQLQFTVRDTGIGLKPEEIDNLFQSFSQADTSTTRRYGGTGLGLSISKNLVEMMHGRISAESTYGEGSTFRFTARFSKSDVSPHKQRPTLAEGIRGRHVLVVDDNASARRIFQEMLESLSLKVTTADSGAAGVEALANATTPVDLVIVDWRMPGMDGFKTIEEIRELSGLEVQPRIIMATAFGREEMFREADAAELDGIILKPANPSTLLDAIMNAFGLETSSGSRRNLSSDYDLSVLRPVQGARILVAEDNEINQQVAQELLEGAGFFVDIASNGREAVQMAGADPYDLVLMDVQMPELDGYEATRQIRELPECADLPILALTAGVMDQEQQRAREVGMVDHVGKPIDIRQLYDALLRWIPHGQRDLPAGAQDLERETEQDLLPVHLEGIDLEQGLQRAAGNRALYRKLLITFYQTKATSLEDLRDYLANGDFEAAARDAHGLAGVAGNVGAAALAAAAKDLEHGLTRDDGDALSILLESAQSQMDVVLASLRSLSESEPMDDASQSLSASQTDWQETKRRLVTLRERVSKFDPAAADVLVELVPALSSEPLVEHLRALEAAIDNFDFEAAQVPLEQLDLYVQARLADQSSATG